MAMPSEKRHKVFVGISGASAMPLAAAFLKLLVQAGSAEVFYTFSPGAKMVLAAEGSPWRDEPVPQSCHFIQGDDMASAPASGGWWHAGAGSSMVVIPCSMNSLACMAAGLEGNLLQRAAAVALKEKRKLLLVTRETPLSEIHLGNMMRLSRAGAVIMPFSPGFYLSPKDIGEMLTQFCLRVLDHIGVPHDGPRWGE